jgi:hypothetical protein
MRGTTMVTLQLSASYSSFGLNTAALLADSLMMRMTWGHARLTIDASAGASFGWNLVR